MGVSFRPPCGRCAGCTYTHPPLRSPSFSWHAPQKENVGAEEEEKKKEASSPRKQSGDHATYVVGLKKERKKKERKRESCAGFEVFSLMTRLSSSSFLVLRCLRQVYAEVYGRFSSKTYPSGCKKVLSGEYLLERWTDRPLDAQVGGLCLFSE